MLHRLTIVLGAVVLLGGLAGLVFGHFSPGWIFVAEGAFVVAAVMFERYRYKPILPRAPQGHWVRTSERFIDEGTGKPVTVYLDPQTGERQYVDE
jgi:hypothetical protein